MLSPLRRAAAAALAFASVLATLAAGPARADDPAAAPESAPATTSSPMTVHAEMLAEHAGSTMSFTPGDVPAKLTPPRTLEGVSTQALSGGGAIPNGLEAEVFGYLPYWMLEAGPLANLQYDLVSTIAYFGLPAQANGTILRSGTYWNGWTSSHMTNVINRAHAEGVKVVLTVTMMGWDTTGAGNMDALLTNAANRSKLAGEIASIVAARNADGVNLDFEPMPSSLRDEYTTFVREVRIALGADPYLTVAVTGGSASWGDGYDLAALTKADTADALMVMGYDYAWAGSSRAGGVAPMRSPYMLDVDTAMTDFLAVVPASKLIWGVPYYGRSWTTTTGDLNATTCYFAKSCQISSGAFRYTDALDRIAQHGRRWDPTGEVPWYRFESATYGTWIEGYYEDAQSLEAKHRRIRQAGMRGVGIWHLLMDGARVELWAELRQHFSALPFSDIDDSIFWKEIAWLSDAGISGGCGGGRFCPDAGVKRAEMASFLVRALGLPSTTTDYFTDDGSSIHQGDINRLAAAGITVGCGGGRFCPNGTVRRDEMASFLARALVLPPATSDFFTDDDGNQHEQSINRLASADIAGGCATGRYCPSGTVTRGQMAAFLYRALAP